MSTTYVSSFVALLAFGLPLFGVEVFDQDGLAKSISDIVGVAAVLYTFYGRYKAGGVNAFGIRIQK